MIYRIHGHTQHKSVSADSIVIVGAINLEVIIRCLLHTFQISPIHFCKCASGMFTVKG